MRITAIKPQKRPGYVSVFLDNEFSFSLSDSGFAASGLTQGQELSAADVEQWRKKSGESKALGFAMRYLALRSRAVAEVSRYLGRKGFEPTEVEAAIARLTELQLLGDASFGSDWVAMRQRTSPRSKQRLSAELRQKGLSREDIEQAVGSIESDESTVVAELIARKNLRQKYYDKPDKLIAYLARQGFSYAAIKKAQSSLDIGSSE